MEPATVLPVAAGPSRLTGLARETLFGFLVREYLHASMVRAAAESQASEHAGRLAATERAESRIEEHVQQLRQELRDRRQEAITEELMDLMTGYRAVGEEEERRRGHREERS